MPTEEHVGEKVLSTRALRGRRWLRLVENDAREEQLKQKCLQNIPGIITKSIVRKCMPLTTQISSITLQTKESKNYITQRDISFPFLQHCNSFPIFLCKIEWVSLFSFWIQWNYKEQNSPFLHFLNFNNNSQDEWDVTWRKRNVKNGHGNG